MLQCSIFLLFEFKISCSFGENQDSNKFKNSYENFHVCVIRHGVPFLLAKLTKLRTLYRQNLSLDE